MEAASTKILQEELAELEDWIEGQQLKISQETNKIEEAYSSCAKNLEVTGAFSDEEIRQQLVPLQVKID